jgi:hypothetical protein
MPVSKIIHVQKNPDWPPNDPRYDIVDDAGFADTSLSFSRQDLGDWLGREGLSFSAIERVLQELDQTGSVQVQVPPRIGPRIVRAWFDTVFNPLIPSLEFEALLLGKHNWTFAYRPAKLERIRPVREHLTNRGQANLDQILELDAVPTANLRSHDEVANRLENMVLALHRSLTANTQFTNLCDSLLAPESLHSLGIESVDEIFGAYPEPDRYNLIAQYVVNNSGELSSHYSTARFWNQNREVLLRSLSLPNVYDRYMSTLQIGQHLESVSQTLVKQLKAGRQDLSLRYDLPLMVGDSTAA